MRSASIIVVLMAALAVANPVKRSPYESEEMDSKPTSWEGQHGGQGNNNGPAGGNGGFGGNGNNNNGGFGGNGNNNNGGFGNDATYMPCPNTGLTSPMCCIPAVAGAVATDCTPPQFNPTSPRDFTDKCQAKVPLCCTIGIGAIASVCQPAIGFA